MIPSKPVIPVLYRKQKDRGGFLTRDDKHSTAKECGVNLYRVEELVSFFPHFREDPPPAVEVHICRDMACHLRGSLNLIEKVEAGSRKHGDEVSVCGVSCLGRCDRAPAAMVNEQLYVKRDAAALLEIVDSFVAGRPLRPNSDAERLKSRPPDWTMDIYDGDSDYQAVRKYLEYDLSNLGSNEIERPLILFASKDDKFASKETGEVGTDGFDGALAKAGLLGMGGAGGRAYKKWREVYLQDSDTKYVVCNADESEPGTFKDRDILVAAPHLVIEGMILGGLAVGAEHGWVYIRHEYHEQAEAVRKAIARARSLGVLGNNIYGSGKSFELDVFVSPGGYICGEQTALIEAMENKRAEPRNRPPELVTNGLHDKPTLLSNVETFAWVPAILMGQRPFDHNAPLGSWFSKQGSIRSPILDSTDDAVGKLKEKMRGRRLFSISGDVRRAGVYEVPTGITLGELIDDYCEGMKDGKELIAAALSGPSGGLVPARVRVEDLRPRLPLPVGMTEIDLRQVPLDINVSRSLGLMMGAGIVIYGTGADVVAESLACSRFFRNETCGKCVPCRLGSQKITEMGEWLSAGKVPANQQDVFRDTIEVLSKIMRETSICGLGQIASNPVANLIRYFPDLVNGMLLDGPNHE